jgi:type IV secretion system protein TrbL
MVIGIGSTMFAALRSSLDPNDMTISQALAVVLGALTLMGLAIFCPRIAAGLVSGAPQLSAGAAAGTMLGVGAAGLAAGAAASAGARLAGRASLATINGAASSAGGVRAATQLGAIRTGLKGPAAAPINAAVGLGAAGLGSLHQAASRVAGHFHARSQAGARAVSSATGGSTLGGASGSPAGQTAAASSHAPWVNRFRNGQQIREGVLIAAHAVGQGDGGGASEGPNLKERS